MQVVLFLLPEWYSCLLDISRQDARVYLPLKTAEKVEQGEQGLYFVVCEAMVACAIRDIAMDYCPDAVQSIERAIKNLRELDSR